MHGLTGGDWKRTGNSPAPRQSPTLLDHKGLESQSADEVGAAGLGLVLSTQV